MPSLDNQGPFRSSTAEPVVPFALANGPEIALTDHIGDRQFAMFWVDDVLKPDMAHQGKDLRSEDDYVGATEDHVSNIPSARWKMQR